MRFRLVAVAAAPAPVIALDGLFEQAGFVWSPDGGFIAGVSHARPSTVVIGNSRTAATRSVRVAQDGEIRSLAWSEDGARMPCREICRCRRIRSPRETHVHEHFAGALRDRRQPLAVDTHADVRPSWPRGESVQRRLLTGGLHA
jgi:hypothetical protein